MVTGTRIPNASPTAGLTQSWPHGVTLSTTGANCGLVSFILRPIVRDTLEKWLPTAKIGVFLRFDPPPALLSSGLCQCFKLPEGKSVVPYAFG